MNRVDAHTHLFAPEQRERRAAIAAADPTFAEMYGDPRAKMADAGQLDAALARAGIGGAVVAGFGFAEEREIETQNHYVRCVADGSAGRLIPLATVNPALDGWERVACRELEGGARGFGELRPHNQGWNPLGPSGRALCGLARDAGAVLLWHVSEPVGHDYPGKLGGIAPRELYDLALAFPGLRMVAAHQGGGLPFYLQMAEVREALADVYFDTAATSLLYDERSIARLVDLAGAGRVLFGSDYPLLSPGRQLDLVLASLPGDAVDAVCGANARNLFAKDRYS